MKVELRKMDDSLIYNCLKIEFEVKFDTQTEAISFVKCLMELEKSFGLI